MYATTSFASTYLVASSDAGFMLSLVIASTVAGFVALLGVGFGIRKTAEYITGESFNSTVGRQMRGSANWEELDVRRRRGKGSRDL
jgi:hypothetical protein